MVIKFENSPNKMGRNGYRPVIIVNHITEGSYISATNWLRSPFSGVSSHFVTSREGQVAQLVDLKDASWCNGTTNNPNDNRYWGKAKNPLVLKHKSNANYYTVTIEHEGWSATTKGALTEAQYKITLELHKHIINEVHRIWGHYIPITRDNISGHFEINPITKPNCPGRLFPFDRLIKDLKAWNYGKGEAKEPILSTEDFIKEIKDDVIHYAKNLLPSVTLAQAIVESDSGNSELAKKANNLFGIKAKRDDWNGNIYKKVTKEFSKGKFIDVTANFREYAEWKSSIFDHDRFFVTPNWREEHYAQVLNAKTPEEQCKALKDRGYATDPNYNTKLMEVIKKYNLKQYDEKFKTDEEVQLASDEREIEIADKENIYVVAYKNDGDLANALALYNALRVDKKYLQAGTPPAIFNGTNIIQVGGGDIPNATVKLVGKNRSETLNEVSKYIENINKEG